MTDSEVARPRPSGRRSAVAVIVAVSVTVLGALIVTAIWALGEVRRQQLTLHDLLSTSASISPVEDTRALCTEMDCIEGWRTDVGVFLRFRTNDMAEYWSYVIGADSIRYENVLLDMNGLDLTRDERRLAIDTLFSRRDWRVI